MKPALVMAIALARTALLSARAGFEDGPLTARRHAAEIDRLRVDVALLREELRIKDARLARIPPHRRPHYHPVVPTSAGFWVPWCPFSLPIVWPFAWTVAVVLDHLSRAVVAVEVYRRQPTAEQICALLDRAILDTGRTPRHLVTDRGTQFQEKYRAWCKRRRIRPRFGAVGRKGSIAIVERFIRSLKEEGLRRVPASANLTAVRREVAAYVEWYNVARPHSSLHGATPIEQLHVGRRTARAPPPSRSVRGTRCSAERDAPAASADVWNSSSPASRDTPIFQSSRCAKRPDPPKTEGAGGSVCNPLGRALRASRPTLAIRCSRGTVSLVIRISSESFLPR